MKSNRAMRKRMSDLRFDRRQRSRPAQDVVRSFSAPHPTKTTLIRHRVGPSRSFSDSGEARYDTSEEECEPRMAPQKAEVPVGPPRKVVASLVQGAGLQRAQLRGPVRSYNPMVRDLARESPNWNIDDYIDEAKDSVDLADVDEVGSSLQAAERHLLSTPGGAALQLGALTSPQAVMLAIQESDDEEVGDFPRDIASSKFGAGEMTTAFFKMNTLQSRQNSSQLSSTQTTHSQASSTTQSSSSTQMVSNSSRSASQMQHHITSEMKAEAMKSDLSNLQSSITEMQNLSSSDALNRLRKSMENLADTVENPPVVTLPDSNSPSPVNTAEITMTMPPLCSPVNNLSAQKINSSSHDKLEFESMRTTASKTQYKTDFSRTEGQRKRGGDLTSLKMGSGTRSTVETMAAERSAFKQEQRTLLAAGEVTQQESGNMAASTMKMKTDSYSTEQKASIAQQQAHQTVTSSGHFSSQEKHVITKGMCTVVSASQKTQLTNGSIKNDEDLSNDSFEDLFLLSTNSSSKDVEKTIAKYSTKLDACVKNLKNAQSSEQGTKTASTELNKISTIIQKAWAVPTHGHELGYSLCNALRVSGGLDLLMTNCDGNNRELQFSSAQLLEQCLTTENRAHVVENGLEKVVKVACVCTKNANSVDHARVGTGILEHLFKHSEGTCSDVIRLGGLDAVLFECRKNDVETLRHCAGALANLSLYGGAENQEAMIKRKVPMWLFPLAFHNDDNIKYYACLAIAVLVANTEIEAAVLKSGTLDLVEPFVTSHNPFEFARSNHAHAHGQSKNWLQKLVPVLSSKREEARNLAAFHFCMEAGIKKQQGNTDIFRDIGAIESLKKVASCPNAVASKYAAQALRLIGEELPHKLSQQVPLWSSEDVREWVKQIGFSEYAQSFSESRVDGDLLLQLTESNLIEDIGITNGIQRRRFTRELQILKKMADYSSRDTANINTFLQSIGSEYSAYTYSMLNAGVDRSCFQQLSDEQLEKECGIKNSIHRIRILDSIRLTAENNLINMNEKSSHKPLDVFISYRRSNGSQLASLLKVHLQLRGYSVFIDVERLEAGKFDNNLLQSIKQAKNFLLVLTPQALDRCISDHECKDWVHKEIFTALKSNCNIIPIMDNFKWPDAEKLPEDMRQICHFNGVPWIHDYQDACVEKLERFMRGERMNTPSTPALNRGPPSYQRMHSSDSSKGSDKDQTNGTRD